MSVTATPQQLKVTASKQQVEVTESQQQLKLTETQQQQAMELELQEELLTDSQHGSGDMSMDTRVKAVTTDSTVTVNKDFLDPISRQILDQVSREAHCLSL